MRVNRIRNLMVLMGCVLAMMLVGCGGGGGGGSDDPLPATVRVTTNQDGAGFTVAAEGGTYSGSGQTYTREVPAGTVTVSFHHLDGYCTPAAITLTGSAGDILNFEGVYTQGCNSTIVINTNLDEARYVVYGPQQVYSGFGKTKEFRVPEGDYIVRFSEVDDACYQRPGTKLFQMRGGEVWEPQFTYELLASCTTPTTYYKDEDGDLYSDGTSMDATGGQPQGYYLPSELIATRGDCDDAYPLENPEETGDYCGAADETVWYYDGDADLYGDANTYIEAETQPIGYVVNANDCNDADDTIHPGATDILDDGIDQDCDPTNDCPTENCSNGVVHYSGRFDMTDPTEPRFEWSGTAIYASFSGTGVSVTLDSGGTNFFEVLIDDISVSPIETGYGVETFELASGLTDQLHSVMIARRTEAFQGAVSFLGFTVSGGSLVASSSPWQHRLEFIGDSITAGYGVLGADQSCNFSPETESAWMTYAAFAARELKSSAHFIAWSGKGVYQAYGGDTTSATMSDLYEDVIPTETDGSYDFSYQAEAVVINLGTNDFSATVDQTSFESAYTDLILLVRSHHPDAEIYCAGGSFINSTAAMYIQNAIYASNDSHTQLLELSAVEPSEGWGCDWHPSEATHARWGGVVADRLKADLGW
jgi:lysophospholipase L1-like esterase